MRRVLAISVLVLCIALVALTTFDLLFNSFKFESWNLPVLYHRWRTNPTPANEAAWKAERNRVWRITWTIEAVEVGVILIGAFGVRSSIRKLRHA